MLTTSTSFRTKTISTFKRPKVYKVHCDDELSKQSKKQIHCDAKLPVQRVCPYMVNPAERSLHLCKFYSCTNIICLNTTHSSINRSLLEDDEHTFEFTYNPQNCKK